MDLKQMLLDDFGKNLPIAGGLGQSVEDPIRLTTSDPTQAGLAQLEIARCIYGINGWYWRVTESAAEPSSTGPVEKFSSEVKYVEADEIVTEKRNFYFDISAVDIPKGQQLPDVRVPLPRMEGLGLPWQLGWFHFDGLIDNEIDHPGLGLSVAYSAPQAKMTIHVYDKGMGEQIKGDPDGAAKVEYLQAISDFESMNPTAQPIREHEDSGVRLKIYDSGELLSAVLVAPFQNVFFKLRLTLEASNEPFMVECAWFTITSFAAMLGKSDDSH